MAKKTRFRNVTSRSYGTYTTRSGGSWSRTPFDLSGPRQLARIDENRITLPYMNSFPPRKILRGGRPVTVPRKGNNCLHVVSYPINGLIAETAHSSGNYIDTYHGDNYLFFTGSEFNNQENELLKDFYKTFDHQKLTTTNPFSTVAFLAELDDTIAMFTIDWWRKLTYGSYTWGLTPFISDVKKLLEGIKRITSNLPPEYHQKSTRTKKFVSDLNMGGCAVRCQVELEVIASKHGDVYYGDFQQCDLLLDKLGIYLDWNTAWDLLPLSFAVDWLLPVGDFLSSIHPSGNIRSIGFHGFQSVKTHAKVTPLELVTGSRQTAGMGRLGSWETGYRKYFRFFDSSILTISSSKNPEFALPSLLQIFNIMYLYMTAKGGRSNRDFIKDGVEDKAFKLQKLQKKLSDIELLYLGNRMR